MKLHFSILVSLVASVRLGLGAPGDLDRSFTFPVTTPGVGVMGLAQQPDGKVIASGGWGGIQPGGHSGIARLELANGALDHPYAATASVQVPRALCFQMDGKLLLAGGFTSVNGTARSRVARLNADGTLDTSFGNPLVGSFEVYAALPQADGKVLIGGFFDQVNGIARNNIARLNADGTLDTGFNPNADSLVQSMALLPDGRIVVVGNFTSIAGSTGLAGWGRAILNADGTLNTATPIPYFGNATTVAVQADGKIIMSGRFTQIAGNPRRGIMRFNADGTLDTGFNPDLGLQPSFQAYQANSIALQADGKIIIAGDFLSVGGVTRNRAARLNADGTLDPSFNPNLDDTANAASIQADGKILIGGMFGNVGSIARANLARFENSLPTQQLTLTNSNTRIQWLRGGSAPEASRVRFEQSINSGASWTQLGQGTRITGGWELTGLSLPANVRIRATALVMGGMWNGSGSLVQTEEDFPAVPPAVVIEQPANTPLTSGGTLDMGSIVTGQSSSAFTFDIRNTGSGILKRLQLSVAGANASDFILTPPSVSEVTSGGSTTFSIVFTPTARSARSATLSIGSNDPTTPIFTVSLAGTGIASPNADLASLVLPSPLSISPAFAANTLSYNVSSVFNRTSITVTPTAVNAISGITVNGVALTSGTTSAPISLTTGANVITIVVTAENGINTKTYTLTVNRAIAPLGGELDFGFAPSVNSTIRTLAVQADGKVLVGGQHFATVAGGAISYGLSRMNVDDTLDTTFAAQSTLTVYDMRLTSTGQIVCAGSHFTSPTTNTTGVNMLNADGTRVSTFDARTNAPVHKIALDGTGRVLVVGDFTSISEGTGSPITRNRMARLSSAGALDTTFDPNPNGAVRCVAVQADGKILIGGSFLQVGGLERSFVARLETTGAVDTSFTAPASVNGAVRAIALQSDGKILIGGDFLAGDGLLRLNADGSADSSYVGTSTSGRQVYDITVLESGKLLVTGLVNTAQGHNAIERLNADGSIDTTFNTSIPDGYEIHSTLYTSSGQIILGGSFNAINGIARTQLGRVDGGTSQNLAPASGTLLEWQRANQPVATATAFDVSSDGGNTWSVVDATGTRNGSVWEGTISTPLPSAGGLLRGRAAIPGNRYAAALSFVASFSPPAAEIVVEEPINNERTDGETINFGSLGLNVLNQVPFTVRNTGGLPLTGIAVTITGTNANQFSLIDAPDATVQPLESTTFVIQAKPTTLGAKTAILSIASNDADEKPFDLTIQCTGVAANLPVVATTTATSAFVNVSGNDIVRATLNGTVDANSQTREVFFDYGTTTAYGTTVPATNPTESGPNAVPVNAVIEGLLPHTTYHFRVRAVSDLGNATGVNRTFLTPNRAPQGVPDNAIVLPLASVTIDATDNDTDPDGDELIVTARTAVTPSTAGSVAISAGKLVFTASAAFGTGVNATATFGYTLSDTFAGGTATSTVTVSPGSCSLSPSGNTVPSAGLTYPITITAGTAPWNVTEAISWASVSPAKGVGDAVVQVTLLPNTATAARTGSVKIGGITHNITQAGVIAPVVSAAVSSTSSFDTVVGARGFSVSIPCTNHPVTFSVVSGTIPPGLTLNSSTGVISGIPTTGGTPTRAYALAIRATNLRGSSTTPPFTINVDALPGNVIGTFHGYVTPSSTAKLTPDPHLGGRFEMTTASTGAFSGQIFEGVTKRSFNGTLAATLPTKQNPTLSALVTGTGFTLTLTLDAATNTLTGSLGDGSVSTDVEGWRNAWTTTAPLNAPTIYATQHNILLRNTDSVNGPQGDGYCSFIIDRTRGTYTLTGKLADETKTTPTSITTSFIGQQGQMLFYLPLYGNRGALSGILRVDPSITGDNQTQGTLTWIKPQQPATSKDTVYKEGFGPLTVSAMGNPHVAPAIGQRVLGAALSASANNSTLSFTGAGLAPDFSQALLIRSTTTTANTATVPPFNAGTSTNLNRVVLPVLNAPAGRFNGSFTIAGATTAANRVAPFYGQIVRIVTPTTDTTRGYGFFLLPTVPVSPQTVSTSPKLSGKVTFTAP